MDDQMLTYPTGKVVGVAPDRGIVDAACNDLEATGVDRGRIEVFGGPHARDESDAEGTGDDEGASHVAFYGRLAVEELQIGA